METFKNLFDTISTYFNHFVPVNCYNTIAPVYSSYCYLNKLSHGLQL